MTEARPPEGDESEVPTAPPPNGQPPPFPGPPPYGGAPAAPPRYPGPPPSGQPGYGPPPAGGQPGYYPPPSGQPGYGPPPAGGQPGYGPPPGAYGAPPPYYGSAPPGGYPGYGPPPGYPAGAPPYGGYPPPGYGATPPSHMSGLAIASLVCSLVGLFLLGIPAVVGIILGFVARSRIKRSGGTERGAGMALAGIIIGFAVVALIALALPTAIHHAYCNNNPGASGCPNG